MKRRGWTATGLVAWALFANACGATAATTDAGPSSTAATTSLPDSSTSTSSSSSSSTSIAPPTTERSPETQRVPIAAGDPVGLAEQILEAETAVRDPDTPRDVLSNAALLQQVVYRQLGRNPEWDLLVLAELPTSLHPAVLLQADARREFRGMHTKLQENLPAWRIVEPEPADELLGYYREAEAEFGIEWEYLASINLVETGMGRIRGTSSAGAQGPMQFIPSTWEAFGEGDVNDPRDAIFGAARYLRHNGGHEGNIDGALFRYNNHRNYVRGVKAYAEVMFDDPQTYYGFHQWQVVFLTVRGDIILLPGYEETEPLPVDDYLART